LALHNPDEIDIAIASSQLHFKKANTLGQLGLADLKRGR
jgi:hypothetical protein